MLCSPEALATVREALATPAPDAAPAPWLMLNRGPADGLPLFDDEQAAAAADPSPPDAGSPDAPCVFVYTSGTTGFPEGRDAQPAQPAARRRGLRRSACTCSPTTACCASCRCSTSTRCSIRSPARWPPGATLILVPRFSAVAFWRAAASTRRHRGQHHRGGVATSWCAGRAASSCPGTAAHGLRRAVHAETYEVFRQRIRRADADRGLRHDARSRAR